MKYLRLDKYADGSGGFGDPGNHKATPHIKSLCHYFGLQEPSINWCRNVRKGWIWWRGT